MLRELTNKEEDELLIGIIVVCCVLAFLFLCCIGIGDSIENKDEDN